MNIAVAVTGVLTGQGHGGASRHRSAAHTGMAIGVAAPDTLARRAAGSVAG